MPPLSELDPRLGLRRRSPAPPSGPAPQVTRPPDRAATPSSAGPISAPRRRSRSPARTSSPARRMLSPSAEASTHTRPLAPCSPRAPPRVPRGGTRGMAAPVEMRTAVPGPTFRAVGQPARDSPITSSSAGGPARTAPVHGRARNGGTSVGLVTSLPARGPERRPAARPRLRVAARLPAPSVGPRRLRDSSATRDERRLLDQAVADPDGHRLRGVTRSSLARMRLVWVRTVSVERPSCCRRRRSACRRPASEGFALAGAECSVAVLRARSSRTNPGRRRTRPSGRPRRTDQVLRGRVLLRT